MVLVMLSPAELAAMRATAGVDALPGTATISRATVAPDGMGGQTQTWATVATVASRLSPSGGGGQTEGLTGGRSTADSDWIITLPQGTDVRQADRIVTDGRTFEVENIADRDWELVRRVGCREVS